MVVNNDDDSISRYPVSNTAILSNTREKEYKQKQVKRQLLILIEKCTHVKSRKNKMA